MEHKWKLIDNNDKKCIVCGCIKDGRTFEYHLHGEVYFKYPKCEVRQQVKDVEDMLKEE